MMISGVRNRYAALAKALFGLKGIVASEREINTVHWAGCGSNGFGIVTRCMTVFLGWAGYRFSP